MIKGIGADGVYYDPMPADKCPDCEAQKETPFGRVACKDHWEDEFFNEQLY